MLALTVAMPGLRPMTVALSRFRTDIADWTPFWRDQFGPSLYRSILTDFVVEGANSGPGWAPLSPAYAAWKAKRLPGMGILVRSGALKASLTGPDASFSIFRPAPQSLEVGSSIPYGIYHQTGTAHMPQRPPLRVDRPFMLVAGKALQKFVQDAWTKRRAEAIATPDTGSAA